MKRTLVLWVALAALGATIASDQPLFLGLSDGQTVVGTVQTADANLRVATRETGSVTLAPASVQTIRSQAEQTAYLAEIERYKNPGLRLSFKR
jgi:hypothetical protein